MLDCLLDFGGSGVLLLMFFDCLYVCCWLLL